MARGLGLVESWPLKWKEQVSYAVMGDEVHRACKVRS